MAMAMATAPGNGRFPGFPSTAFEIDNQTSTQPKEMNMNAFKKTLVAIAALATLGATGLASTQASANGYGYGYGYGYGSYGGYGYNSYSSYGSGYGYGRPSYGYGYGYAIPRTATAMAMAMAMATAPGNGRFSGFPSTDI